MDRNWWEDDCIHCRREERKAAGWTPCEGPEYEPGSIKVPLPKRVSSKNRQEKVQEELLMARYKLLMVQLYTKLGIGDGSF